MSKQRKSYSKEFKEEAVKLAKSEGVTKASKELGVHQASLNRWMKMENPGNTTSAKSQSELESEVRKLRKENLYLKKINEVLKKSTAIFSKDHIGDSK